MLNIGCFFLLAAIKVAFLSKTGVITGVLLPCPTGNMLEWFEIQFCINKTNGSKSNNRYNIYLLPMVY